MIFKEQEINPKLFLKIKFENNKDDLIENIKRYCELKKINKISEYKRISKNTAKEFNIFTFRELNAVLGSNSNNFFEKRIGIKTASSYAESKYLNPKFIEKAKLYCREKSIITKNDWDKKRDKNWMPTRERLRQLHGKNYLYEKIGLKATYLRPADYLTDISIIRKICANNNLFNKNFT